MASDLGLGMHDLFQLVASAPRRYKVYEIEKKSGGTRTIAQPSRELKVVQRYLVDKHLCNLRVHPSASAYRIGTSIRDNAQQHVASSIILKLDFENFFNSVLAKDWHSYLRREYLADDTKDFLKQMTPALFWGRGTSKPQCLSIGAPSSPHISNLVMYRFDQEIFDFSAKHNVVYTRYADDTTLSGQDLKILLLVEQRIRSTLHRLRAPALRINEEKRGIYSKAQRRLVTGLVITPNGEVSLGRSRKREISSMLHKFGIDDLSVEDKRYLKGMLGFAIANEPEFVRRLEKKYGKQLVSRAKKFDER